MADPHSISENHPNLYGRQKTAVQAAARVKLGWTHPQARWSLTDLFDAVSRHLGKEWRSKPHGYALLIEFTGYKVPANPATDRLRKSCPKKKGSVKKSKPTTATSTGVDVRSDEFLSSYEWRRLRMVVIKKRSPRCECCGATPADGQTVINVDHIKPRKLHPELALEESNLQILCHVCNHGKGNWDDTDWRDWQPPETYEPVWTRRVQ